MDTEKYYTNKNVNGNVCFAGLRTTACSICERNECKKHIPSQSELKGNFNPSYRLWREDELVSDAQRCLYCGIPQCSIACPAMVNTKDMVHAAGVRNWYFAAKVVLSANPLALSTSYLCECESGLCRSGCVLSQTNSGAIHTNEIQKYAVRSFLDFGIKATRNPLIEIIDKSVGIIGAGAMGISCATYLARLGIKDIVIYEKEPFAGGLLMTAISENRLPANEFNDEFRLLKDLGITVLFNCEVGKNITIEDLQQKHDTIVIGTGNPNYGQFPFEIPKEWTNKVLNSQIFLRNITDAVKRDIKEKMPDLTGKRVVVLGAGDVAIDCCEAAYRCGAEHVIMAFRKEFKDIRASRKGIDRMLNEGIEFLSLSEPEGFSEDSIIFRINEFKNGEYNSTDSKRKIEADLIIFAFGTSGKHKKEGLFGRFSEFDRDTRKVSENIYVGGDFAGGSTVIEAVNDGKNVAVSIYKDLTERFPDSFMLDFHTDVDEVDLSVNIDGIKYINPMSISSAPISLTYSHLKRAFEAGFGAVVTKTIALTKDIHYENALRIFKMNRTQRAEQSYWNNCMISDHPHEYWIETINKLKSEFPERIIIASIMCSHNKEDWQLLAKLMEDAGADALELNFSCPNQCAAEGDQSSFADKEKLMAMAIGQVPEALKECTQFVKEVVSIPVYPKLTPNTTHGDIDDYAQAAFDGGANGVSFSNTVSSLPKIFPNGYPYPQIGKSRCNLPSGGYSGSAIRPIVLAGLCKIRNRFPDKNKFSILGIGGVESGDTALQLIHAGAKLVQVCSSVQTYSYEIVQEFLNGLKFFLYCYSTPRLRGYIDSYTEQALMPSGENEVNWIKLDSNQDEPVPTIADRVGKVNEHLKNRDQLEHPNVWMAKAFVDENQCIGCATCVTSCRDNAANAFDFTVNGKVKVKEDWCIGCMLCVTVCPVNAIVMKEVAPQQKLYYKEE